MDGVNNHAAQLCACGSGLRRSRCCGLCGYTPAPASAARHLVSLIEGANEAHGRGDTAQAEQLCLDTLELAPELSEALKLLYDIRRSQGSARAAEALIRRIVQLDPNDFAAASELALILLGRRELGEAELHARNAVRIAPENPQAHNLMGMVLTDAQRQQAGEFHYRRVIELSGRRDPIVLANLAWNLKCQGRMAEARALYEESTSVGPAIRQTLLGWARLEEADRNFERAAAVLDHLETHFPGDAAGRLTRAVLLGRMHRPGEALSLLDGIADGSCGSLGPDELLEKGRLLDRMGCHDAAFAAFTEAKRLARQLASHAYLADEVDHVFARLRSFFVAGRLRTLPRAGVRADVAQPLFILGFPRSGTTLVEQTLSAHSRIAAGDELPLINDIAGILPRMLGSPLGYPEALSELWMGDQRAGLDNLRDYYLQKAGQMGIPVESADWFTDKMPLNEMHLGLIGLLFPEAPLIHVIRHPLDVMVSVAANHFTHGYHCGSTLETAAQHYVKVMALVRHYRDEMKLRYLPLHYEDIVRSQEASVQRMLNFIGAEFEPVCLRFHENRRYARTASYAQVAEMLYDRSRNRYRHYLHHLKSVIPILEPTILQLGYSIT